MTKLYASSSKAASSQGVSCESSQEATEPYERLVREIKNQLDEFPIGETVLVGNCPPDVSEEEINNFFHGFANAVRLKKILCKSLTTTLFIAKFDSAESASRSKVLHTLSLKDKKILLLPYEDRQLFGKSNVVELNGFQDHPEELIYDHMSAFGQVNFILKTKSVAYIVYEDSSSVDACSRCDYLDQYPVSIRSVLDTSIGSVTSGSAAIESCILEQIDQHSSLLVEEEEGQINNFIQLLDMDNLDEYMEMNEREKSTVVDKPLLEVGNEEIIENESEEDANVADVAAIEKQAFQRPSTPKCRQVEMGFVLVDDRSASQLGLEGNMLRLSDLPRLNVRLQKMSSSKKVGDSKPNKKHKKVSDDSKPKKNRAEGGATEKRKKDKKKKGHSDNASKVKTEKTKTKEGLESKIHREASPAKNPDKPKKERTKSSQSADIAIKTEPDQEKNAKNQDERSVSPPKKSTKEKRKKERAKTDAVQPDAVVSEKESLPPMPKETVIQTDECKVDEPRESSSANSEQQSQNIAADRRQRKPVVILKRLTAKQLEELSIVRRVNADQPKQQEQQQNKQDKPKKAKHLEKEKRKKSSSKHLHEPDGKKRKIAKEPKEEPEQKPEQKPDLPVLATDEMNAEPEECIVEEKPQEPEAMDLGEDGGEDKPVEPEKIDLNEDCAEDKPVEPETLDIKDDCVEDKPVEHETLDLVEDGVDKKTEDPETLELKEDDVEDMPAEPETILTKEDTVDEVVVPMEVEVPTVDEQGGKTALDTSNADCSTLLLSDDEEQRLVMDLPVESKPEVEKPAVVVQPEQTKPKQEQRTVVKLDARSATILSDKVHDTFLLHLDVLSRVLIKLNKVNIASYVLPKPVKPGKSKSSNEPPPRKSTSEKKKEEKSVEKVRKTDLEKIDNKFLPAGSKLKSQAKAKSKSESSHKKQHHVPVPDLPIELKTHLNTSFKIPKKNSHSSKANSIKHNRSELDCLHRADDEKERQRKRFQKEQKHPNDRHRERTKKPVPIIDLRSNSPDFFDPSFDDDGGGGGDTPPPAPEPVPRVQEVVNDGWKQPNKPSFVYNNNERPSFRDIWNFPKEKPQVWTNAPWAPNPARGNVNINSGGEMWGSRPHQPPAAPVLPLFARDQGNNQRSNNMTTIDAGDRWSPERERPPPNLTGRNTIDAGESWSPGRQGPPSRQDTSTERRTKQPDHNRTTIADGESWSPEADTSVKITALNVDHRPRPPSRQNESQHSRRISSPVPHRSITSTTTTISSGDMWDTKPAAFAGGKQMSSGVQVWENPSKENLVPDFLSDEVIRGAADKPWANDRFRGGRRSPDMDDRERRHSRDRSPEEVLDRRRRRSPNRSPVWRRSPDRRPRERSPPRRISPDHRNWNRDGSFNRSLERSPPRRFSPDRRPPWAREGSPGRGLSPDRKGFARDGSPRRGLDIRISPERRGYTREGSPLYLKRSRSRTPEYARQRSPDRRRAWSPFGRGVIDSRRRSRSRSPLHHRMDRSRSPEQRRQSPVRRGAARFRSRSRSRDRYEDQFRTRTRSRSPPPRYQREISPKRERDEIWGRPRIRDNAFNNDRNVFCSSTQEQWDAPSPERSPSPQEHEREAAQPAEPPKLTDEEIPYSPSHFLDEEEANVETPLETIPLLLPPMARPKKQPETVQQPTEEQSVQVRIKQERIESVAPEEVPATVQQPVNVKQETCSSEEPIEQRVSSLAMVSDFERNPSQTENMTRLSALGHLKQRAERLKKLEDMKMARQKLLAQIKLQSEMDRQESEISTGSEPQQEASPQKEKEQQPVQPAEPVQPVKPVQSVQPVPPEVQKVVKKEPECDDRVPTPNLANIKQELQQVEPAAATLLLETAVSILSSFGHLLPGIGSLQTAVQNPVVPPPFPPPVPPVLPPPLPLEAPPLPKDPPPMPPFPHMAPPMWNPTAGFPPLPNIMGLPPPPMAPIMPPVPFEKEQQRSQVFPMKPDDGSSNWQQQGPTYDEEYEDQSQNFNNYDEGPDWRPQEQMGFNDEPDWRQSNSYNNQQPEEAFQLLPPEEFWGNRNEPQQFNNQRNRDPRQRFRGNNRGHHNNKMFRDPRRGRGGHTYAGGGGGGHFQQQQQQQQWNQNAGNTNFNRDAGGGFGNQYRNNQNRTKRRF